MLNNSFVKFIIIFMLGSNVYAYNHYVKCPDLRVIRVSSSKLVEAALVNGAYIANTMPYAISAQNKSWFAVVYNINAATAKEALATGKLAMQSVIVQDNPYANNLGGIFVCDYDNRKVEVINNE